MHSSQIQRLSEQVMERFIAADRARRNADTSRPSAQSETTEPETAKGTKIRLHSESCLTYSFLWRGKDSCPTLESHICREKLSNAATVPSELKRRLFSHEHIQRLREVNEKRNIHVCLCKLISLLNGRNSFNQHTLLLITV